MKISRLAGCLLLFCSLWTHAALAAPAKADALAAPPAPVVFQGTTLFHLNTRVGAFSPEARAQAIATRLDRLTDDPFHPIPALLLVNQEQSADIVCGDTILATFTEADARAEGIPLEALARQRMAALQAALETQTWKAKLQGFALVSLWVLLATIGGLGLLGGVRAAFNRFRRRILAVPEGRFLQFKVQNLVIVSSGRMRQSSMKGLGLLQGLLMLVLGYVYLSIIFSFFPITRGFAAHLSRLALGPLLQIGQDLLDYLPSLFSLLLIALGTRYLLKMVHLGFKGLQSGAVRIANFHPDWAEPTYRLVRFFLLGFALVVAFPFLPGSGSEAFKGVSIFFGLVFSLGSSGAVSNAVAGVLITYMRPFQVGDRIAVGETVGDVVEKSLLVTRIRTIKNIDVTIPNAMLLGTQVQNYSVNAASRGLILHTTVTIGYDAPWRIVHALLAAAAAATQGILEEPKPFVLQTSLDDFYVSYQINAYTDQAAQMAVIYSELHANIQEKFNEAGVEIMSPHYRSERDGNQTSIPAQHLPKDYVAPTFRVTRS